MQLKSSIKSFNSFIIGCIGCQLLLISCAQTVNQPIVESNREHVLSEIVFYDDSLGAQIITDSNLSNVNQLILQAEKPLSIEYLIKTLQPNMDDSTLSMVAAITSNKIAPSLTKRTLREIKQKDGTIQFYFTLDTAYIFPLLRKNIQSFTNHNYIHALFNINPNPPEFDQISASTKLALPIANLDIPTKASRLPNAPRSYRSGIHRGIDFFSNWGTPVVSVADGIIIRSDLSYKEYPADFRREMLKRAALLDRTPSDIFNELLLGQAVIIDHGFELFNGYRAITIYAHLSEINSAIKPGYTIKAGEIFAKSGNSGTEPSTLGTRDESHLHWELILQNQSGEYYFGQNLGYEQLIIALNQLFNN